MELRRLADRPDELLWRYLAYPVKIGHSSLIVVAELPLSGGPIRVVYKQYRPRNWWKALWGAFRRSRALEGWRLARALLERNVATARPIAACQPRPWPSRGTSYLATAWIEGAENLHRFGWRLAALSPDRRLRSAARCAESLGRLVGRMHAAGIANRDLKGVNLLVVQHGDDLQTYLVDLDGVRLTRGLRPQERAANLARLAVSVQAHPWVSRSVCRRFLRAYAAQFAPQTVAWKPLWRAVAARARAIVRRKRRRGQPIL
ncbi:MAG: lipopolysaccharide kinase InaA family protein [Thermoguttaceae bacterium]